MPDGKLAAYMAKLLKEKPKNEDEIRKVQLEVSARIMSPKKKNLFKEGEEKMKTYAEFKAEILAWWKKNHTISSPPREHVISKMYDDYLETQKDKKN